MMNDSRDEDAHAADDPVIDAGDLVIEESRLDDDDYDEVIILDLSQPDRYDLWLC